MIYAGLFGLGLWVCLGLYLGWTALAFAVGGFLIVMFSFLVFDLWWARRHRYEDITPQGRRRLGK